ncbi:MAG: BCCT family transporter [Paracoccaceae bacterium]
MRPGPTCVFWCVTAGVVAMGLLSAGGLIAMRTASLISARPLTAFPLVALYRAGPRVADRCGRAWAPRQLGNRAGSSAEQSSGAPSGR